MMPAIKAKAKIISTKGEFLNQKIKKTMTTLSDIVGVTLGPGGNPVLLDRPGTTPLVTKDGVTVANHVAFDDPIEHVISEAAKEVCQKTNTEAGDGTTTAIVLAQELTSQGLNVLAANKDISPQLLCRELDAKLLRITDFVTTLATKVQDCGEDGLKHVAMISANGDEESADAVIKAINYVGEEGTIVTEEGSARHTHVEMHEGYAINKGLSVFGGIQAVFINNPSNHECVFNEPRLILYDGEIIDQHEFMESLGYITQMYNNRGEAIPPLVIIAHKFSPNFVNLMALNVQANTIRAVLVETAATGHPQSKHDLLNDLASYSGGKVYDPLNNKLNGCDPEHFGNVSRIKVGRYKTVLFGPPENNKIKERMDILNTQLDLAESTFDADLIRERISKLHGGIATIYVGADSELEMREKKHRIEDAVNAVRAAIESGVVPGGGVALLLASYLFTNDSAGDVILRNSLKVPFFRILTNAGERADEISEIESNIKKENGKLVRDALNHKYANPINDGIIDPTKVTLTSLSNAVSIAKMLMTIGGSIVLPRDPEAEKAAELAAMNIAQQMQGA